MTIELGYIAQSQKAINTPSINTVSFLGHDAIKNIPADRKIVHVCILADYTDYKSPTQIELESQLVETS